MNKKSSKKIKSEEPMQKGKPIGMSLPEFKKKIRRDAGLPEESTRVEVIEPEKPPSKTTDQKTDASKSIPPKSVEIKPVSPVVPGPVDMIDRVILQRKRKLFGGKVDLSKISISDLELLKQQKLREEEAEKHRLEDERTLAQMREQKHEYYDTIRDHYFKMSTPFEDRFVSFLNFYAANADRINVLKSRGLLLAQIRSEMELFGLKVSDKKHVFTDAELEQFRERCQAEKISCPFDSFAIHAMQTLRVRSDADVHRKQLMETVVGEKE